MSVTTTAMKKLRIAAIPLTRPRLFPAPGPASTAEGPSTPLLNSLTYYQFQISTKRERKRKPPAQNTTSSKLAESSQGSSWFSDLKWPEEGIVQFATHKAGETWTGFGKAKGGWKLKTYQFGEKLIDRLDFEELALKSIDPSLGPSITHLKRSGAALDDGSVHEHEKKTPTISLIYPPSILTPTSALEELRTYAQHRIPKHKRGFIMWMIIAPFTAPFMIIPIIPNLPFFFCAWRSWSHYKAYRASEYLQSLLEHGIVVPEASPGLDGVYKRAALEASSSNSGSSTSESEKPESGPSTTSTASQTPEPKHALLLRQADVPHLLEFLQPPSSSVGTDSESDASSISSGFEPTDIYRAVEQARVRVESGRDVL